MELRASQEWAHGWNHHKEQSANSPHATSNSMRTRVRLASRPKPRPTRAKKVMSTSGARSQMTHPTSGTRSGMTRGVVQRREGLDKPDQQAQKSANEEEA